MKKETELALTEINRIFYNQFGEAFAATRKRIQPGVRKIIKELSDKGTGNWIDLGCGSGTFGAEWASSGMKGSYLGLDFSLPLLDEAEKKTLLTNQDLTVQFVQKNLMNSDWDNEFKTGQFSGAVSFAFLHHIPGRENHHLIFEKVHRIISEKGLFILSVWQFQNSPKMLERVQSWDKAPNIDPLDLESGDTLLDWRYALPGSSEKIGLRYVHLFQPEELQKLASDAGFQIKEAFFSDGKDSNLAYYLILQKS